MNLKKKNLAVIGLGYVGLPLAVEFSKKYKVVGFDLDPLRIEELNDCFDRTNQNLIIVQDEQGNSFGVQKINRKRKKFETANFKIAHNDLFNKFTTEIIYSEYKAIGDNNDK